ncbi:MAG TPA: GHMP kinase [Anaerolineaceae bacterium]|nr:GHMP kinase [Anaerolineaceae bacterium]
MIITQTPLRVSFFGGGTDFPSYYLSEGGCVLSTAIDKYIFVTIKQRFDDKLRIGYTRTEMVDAVDEIQHELIREALRNTGIQKSIEIITTGDIPAGTGLGSSSTVTVGSLNAMYHYLRRNVSAEQLAKEACEIEIDRLGKPIGVQDQYIAALGGMRFIEFHQDGQVVSREIELQPMVKRRLNESLLLFFTGQTRTADTILTEQKNNISDRLEILREMKKLAYRAHDELCAGNLDALGYLLDEHWQLKKHMASQISNGQIENWYQAARSAGALGGKITGAGGGGFLLLYCPYGKREAVRAALPHLRELPFQLEPDGSKVIFNYRRGY